LKLVSFIADNADAALAKIHAELGPEAVVVNVRRKPANGIARLWQRNRLIEVTAGVPPIAADAPASAPRQRDIGRGEISTDNRKGSANFMHQSVAVPVNRPDGGRWRSIAWLESKGLLPSFLDRLEEKVHVLYGQAPNLAPEKEWAAVTDLMTCHWRPTKPAETGTGRPHVFIGPAGSGKTTILCKWMASAVLLNEQSVRVWRMDGESANTSELLTLHCESMGVPVERAWQQRMEMDDLRFVDLPGVEINNHYGISALKDQISMLPQPHVHLVLNAAYETTLLFEQFEAFASFQPEDIIFTHLDEERRRVKLWNFVFGTNCPVSYLSTGQKIPGRLEWAEPASLFPKKNRQ
jgi:flagellar biosynthesis GTPase FlhF